MGTGPAQVRSLAWSDFLATRVFLVSLICAPQIQQGSVGATEVQWLNFMGVADESLAEVSLRVVVGKMRWMTNKKKITRVSHVTSLSGER